MNEKTIIEDYKQQEKTEILKRSSEQLIEAVNSLLSKMTLAEKVGQMYQAAHFGAELVGPSVDNIDTVDLIKQGRVGSILSMSDKTMLYKLQKLAVEESRLRIPLLYAYDVVHGYKTIFPISLGLACTWDETIVKKTSEVAATEAARSGIHMTFAPMLDVVKDPRWGRVMESFGEDHYLGSVYAKAYVEGFQKDSLTSRNAVAACAKHFIGYGLSEAGREYNTVDLSEMKLRQEYLPPFKAAIDAGVASVMSAFNVVGGIPATGNKYLLRNLLKDELSYKGMVISDYDSSGEMIHHKTARDLKEVAEKSLIAGLDMEMVTKSYVKHLEIIVDESPYLMPYVDDSVRRILTLKYNLGLFDDPYKGLTDHSEDYTLTEEHRKIAYEAAVKSIVLLENDGVLPLSQTQTVGLIGPFVQSNEVNGAWSALGNHQDTVTLAEGFKEDTFVCCQGCSVLGDDLISESDLAVAMADVDVIVLAIGEDENMSGEGASRAFLDLPGRQNELIEMVSKLNKPCVTVVFSGRPLDLRLLKEHSNALVQGWFLGSESGYALADVLKGVVAPSGRLSMSMPYCVGQVPVYYNQLPTGRPVPKNNSTHRFSSRYIDIPNEPLYAFGHGLTYTIFEYSHFTTTATRLTTNENVLVRLKVTNSGEVTATETVQLYIEASYHSVSRPVKELKMFKQVRLKPGEHEIVEFDVGYETLCHIDEKLISSASAGCYMIHIGKSSSDIVFTKEIVLEVT